MGRVSILTRKYGKNKYLRQFCGLFMDGNNASTETLAGRKPFRVLTLDGGGMRGIYTASYLAHLCVGFAQRRKLSGLDLGRAFDLIVGTSTGGIVAAGLAANVPLTQIVDLYRHHGRSIFPRPLPRGILGVLPDIFCRRKALANGDAALKQALIGVFGETTLGQVYASRGVALAITTVNLSRSRSWVFKTPHLPHFYRDAGYQLVDVCLATSSAPIYRSLAAIDSPHGLGFDVFVDGGLWANNPVLVGLVESLDLAAPQQPIEIFSLGTCSQPTGKQLSKKELHRGLLEWQFGSEAAVASISAQEFAYDQMARKLANHLNRPCKIIRFPREELPAGVAPYLALDDTREKAYEALIGQARHDADMTCSQCNDTRNESGTLIRALFEDAPSIPEVEQSRMISVGQA